VLDSDEACTGLVSRYGASRNATPIEAQAVPFPWGMTPLHSGQPERHRTSFPSLLRGLPLLLGLALLPGVAGAQVRSGIASVALTAYAAPGVRWSGAASEMGLVTAGSTAALTGMTVNTGYRIEQRVSTRSRVVLLSRGVAGAVPWDRIRAGLDLSAGEPVLIDVVVTPAL
jgi:anti-sigma factor RsiW